jgi:hypothetical protein
MLGHDIGPLTIRKMTVPDTVVKLRSVSAEKTPFLFPNKYIVHLEQFKVKKIRENVS